MQFFYVICSLSLHPFSEDHLYEESESDTDDDSDSHDSSCDMSLHAQLHEQVVKVARCVCVCPSVFVCNWDFIYCSFFGPDKERDLLGRRREQREV